MRKELLRLKKAEVKRRVSISGIELTLTKGKGYYAKEMLSKEVFLLTLQCNYFIITMVLLIGGRI